MALRVLNPRQVGTLAALPTPLAAQSGRLEVVRLLLESGANTNAAMANGATAMQAAAVGTWQETKAG